MKTYPLRSMSLDEAREKQFKIVDTITRNMTGKDFLQLGDLGVAPELNKPEKTEKVEKIIAEIFNSEACMLTRGAGTHAIRLGILSAVKSGSKMLIHKAPVYPTTEMTIRSMGIRTFEHDFNSTEGLREVLEDREINFCLLQHTRQKPDDSYNLKDVIEEIKGYREDMIILVDDNYAVMKVDKIGTECGGDLSAFSMFKLLGPVGIGCLVGKEELIRKVCKYNYSGGGQVQGYEAMEALRGLTYAPVALALQAEESEKLVRELNNKQRYPYIKDVFIANAQSKVILIEFNEDIAERVLHEAEKMGALPNPVGAESKFEIPPLFYKVSGTFLKYNPDLRKRMIRINPNRSGAGTVIRILEEAYRAAQH